MKVYAQKKYHFLFSVFFFWGTISSSVTMKELHHCKLIISFHFSISAGEIGLVPYKPTPHSFWRWFQVSADRVSVFEHGQAHAWVVLLLWMKIASSLTCWQFIFRFCLEYINSHSAEYGVELRYSTLAEVIHTIFKVLPLTVARISVKISYFLLNILFIQFFTALHSTSQAFPVFKDDFFPYADNDDSWWTVSHP